MSKETKNPEVETEEVEVVEIIRGRMPVAQVAAIRFLEDKEATDASLAAKYRTTNGKISDIRKGRNFGYLTEDTVFSQDEVDAAIERCQGLGEATDAAVELLNTLVLGDEDALKARDESRKASRKPRGKSKVDEAEETASENVAEEVVEDEEVDLDDLLD